VARNIAGNNGGAIAAYFRSMPGVVNCTLTGNSAAASGGGIHCEDHDTELALTNSVLWADQAPIGSEVALINGIGPAAASIAYSALEGGAAAIFVDTGCILDWGIGNIDADPLFVGPDNDDYRLSAGSPCIDAGCNGVVPADVADLDEDGDTEEITPLDLDGEGRFFDDPDTPDSGCGIAPIVDMGAYQYGDTGPQPCPGDMDGDRDVDQSDLGILLSLWGATDRCDLDCDGDIDEADLGILLGHWGAGCP